MSIAAAYCGVPVSIPAGNGRESAATSAPVSTPTTPGSRERRGRVDLDPGVRELRADDRRVEACGDGREIVEEPALAAEQRVVLDAQHAPADPGRSVVAGSGVPRRERTTV